MNSRLEDLLGKSLMIAIFLYLAIMQANTIVVVVQLRDQLDLWPFVLASRVSGLAFLTLVVFLTVIRRAPKNVSAGIQPRVTAIAGTFCLMFLAVVPTGNPGPGLQVAAASLMTLGTILSIWCAIYLGRSFSIMAAARHLVVQGPYALVRHPLYAAERWRRSGPRSMAGRSGPLCSSSLGVGFSTDACSMKRRSCVQRSPNMRTMPGECRGLFPD